MGKALGADNSLTPSEKNELLEARREVRNRNRVENE